MIFWCMCTGLYKKSLQNYDYKLIWQTYLFQEMVIFSRYKNFVKQVFEMFLRKTSAKLETILSIVKS